MYRRAPWGGYDGSMSWFVLAALSGILGFWLNYGFGTDELAISMFQVEVQIAETTAAVQIEDAIDDFAAANGFEGTPDAWSSAEGASGASYYSDAYWMQAMHYSEENRPK